MANRPPKNAYGRVVAPVVATLAVVAGVLATTPVTAHAQVQAPATCGGYPVTVDLAAGETPTDGDDVIVGTSGPDVIAAGPGNDVVCGGDGDDKIWGQAGDDMLFGEGGADRLRGGDGNDSLRGGDGADDLNGGRDNDNVFGQGGDDPKVRGGTGDDRVDGGPGNDLLVAGNGGEDYVRGGDGDDALVTGGPRQDVVAGGNGNDLLKGHKGADRMLGGYGDDDVRGGEQSDVIEGGPGTDSCNGGLQDDLAFECEIFTGVEVPLGRGGTVVLRANWALKRDDIVADIWSNNYGIGPDNVLRGPAGFEIDLSECPAGWNNYEGLGDGKIEIALTAPLTGSVAAWGTFSRGMQGYFNLNAGRDGIGTDERQIEATVIDDQYVAVETQDIVEGLLVNERPFAITTLGSPNSLAVYDRLDQACVPHPFVQSGHQAWADPENHPWTTGSQMSYQTEAELWVAWIEQNLGDRGPVSVGALVMDNDFGLAYEQSFARAAAESAVIGSFNRVRHDPAAAVLDTEIEAVGLGEPDVFIAMTAGNPCLLAFVAADQLGLTDSVDAHFAPSVCRNVASNLTPAGEAAEGWLVMGGGLKDHSASEFADDPFIAELNTFLPFDAGEESLYATGWGLHGWSYVEALQIAAQLPGGLSRTNLMLALRSLDLDHPMLRDGIAYEMNGNADASAIEGSEVSRFDYATQSWVITSILDLNGQTPNCRWTPAIGCS